MYSKDFRMVVIGGHRKSDINVCAAECVIV